MATSRIGIWLVGARGGVATTSMVGLTALQHGWIGTEGLVSELPQFAALPFVPWRDLVIGGHDVRTVSTWDAALALCRVSRALDEQLVERARPALLEIDRRVRQGTLWNVGSTIAQLADDDARSRDETPGTAVARLQADMAAFVQQEELRQLIVVNVASTEPPLDVAGLPARWSELAPLLERPDCPLPASSLYAIAALDAGYPYINFTPSVGAAPAAIQQLALQRGTCHMGCDGKTGETLLKSVLAPMFAQRHLHVMSWVGHNIFGNLDGKVLEDPLNKASKVISKDRLLSQIFGYTPQTLVSIEYIESLGDWKTAWDHVHFRGFLGTPMTLQFTWQGCDSLLAAPLLLDLVRFTELAQRRGARGLLTFLASFFKSPLGVTENDFCRQFQLLETWARSVGPQSP